MEKFYTITKESPIHGEYFQWKENMKIVNSIVKSFMKKWDMETTQYYVDTDRFYIVPTSSDYKLFREEFTQKGYDDGLRAFKKASNVGKDWLKTVKENSLEILHKPIIMIYFNTFGGKSSYRLFDYNKILYASYHNEYNFDDPKGFIPMSGSDFYKIMEEFNG